ncbi:hypothetical protein MSHOH_2141 [Methanosarcina horonobensis HB-1 = JCM 15518]|uniref:Uncharacterized protein n=1 Tax=Methanosarcina horonobensis HB-1 = JCM 15518 TaxID=1434110 RepID=A0A0E3SAA9_9EURY|nr:hypothetical protein [Methanosarcina horonobensis]AKB78624.1 hypothetical protein MSHOH_2141 [Methanosarcina horonobensis HB-1 = JCM 15518]
MSANIEGNALASQNGCLMEHWIKALYPSAEFRYKGAIDCIIDGVRVEIKSCQEFIHDSEYKNNQRSGRICFNSQQHEILVLEGGDYIFLVHRNGNPFIFVRLPASSLSRSSWSGVKCVSWKTLLFGGVLI